MEGDNPIFPLGSTVFLILNCRNRIFTGPDGREYVWKLTMTVCKVNGDAIPTLRQSQT